MYRSILPDYLTEGKKPAYQGPARHNVRLQYLVGRVDHTAHKPHQLRDHLQTLWCRQILHGYREGEIFNIGPLSMDRLQWNLCNPETEESVLLRRCPDFRGVKRCPD